MRTVLDIIHATDKVSQRVASAQDDENRTLLSPKEQAESIIAKNRVLGILSRSIKDIESALSLRADNASDDANDPSELAAMDAATDAENPPEDVLREGMSGSKTGLGSHLPSLSKMAEDIGPIVDTFGAVLVKPYLKNYNALLNSVPIVGLKGDNVMYTETRSGGLRGVEDVWSVFGRIPKDVNINSSTAVHFFPYKGDFCMSVGTSIYRKRHRDDKDPEIKTAVDHWPKLYLDDWEKVGDSCLPTPNARNVLPFARLVGKDIKFHLVVLAEDGRLLALNGDLNGSNNTFSELKNFSENAKAKSLKVQQAAYWNGNIVAVDSDNNTWNLDADFDQNTFTAGDRQAFEPILELTATDIGPVGVKKDGWIYRRRLETVNDPSDSANEKDKRVGWEKWLQQNGVTHLGVASPGVMLNLDTLSRSLRDRYMSTQTSIYPVMNKIQSFTINYEYFLKKQLEAAKEYQKNKDNKSKQEMAIEAAESLVRQTKVWSSIMRKQTGHTQLSVNLMSEQLSTVRAQLDSQLIVLRDKLVSLKAQIKALQEAKAKMDAAFWGSIGVMLLGIALAVIGVATGVGVVALGIIGGALFVGGLVAACYFGTQSTKLAGEIQRLEAEARGVSSAIADITFIADKFGDLEKMYGSLNQFWGRMFNASGNLKTMNEATAAYLGDQFLDATSIEASIDVVRKMKNGCATYLAVLNKYGIHIKDDSDDEDNETADIMELPIDLTIDPTFKTVQIFNKQVERANQAFEDGKFAECQKHLEAADLIDTYTIQLGIEPDVISQVINNGKGQETAEAADIISDLTRFAIGVALGPAFAFDVVGDTGTPPESADLFGDLLRFSPLGIAATAIEGIFSNDVVVNSESSSLSDKQKETADILGDVSKFAEINPIGRVVGAIGKAAIQELLKHNEDIAKSPAADTSGEVISKDTEAADLFGTLADFARITPFGQVVGLLEGVLSRDVDLGTATIQKEPQEAADIFSVIADFARFVPGPNVVGTITGNSLVGGTGELVRAAGIPAQGWFLQQGLAASMASLSIAAPFSPDHPQSGMLNGILAEARGGVLTMLSKTLELTSQCESWLQQIPDVPTSPGELSLCTAFQGQALLSCKLALEQSRLANNSFVKFNHMVRDEYQRLEQEITTFKDMIGSVQAQGRNDMERAERPKVEDFLSLGLTRTLVPLELMKIEQRVRREISNLEHEIERRVQEQQQGGQLTGHSKTWVELCERTSGNLGSIYNTLTCVKYGIKVDAQAYKELGSTQWNQIRKEAEEVKSLLQPRQDTRDMITMDLIAHNSSELNTAAVPTDTALVDIASPTAPLIHQLRAQANNSNVVWENLGKLQRMPYTDDIVGYIDTASNRKTTLLEIISDIKGTYIQTAVLHYETIEQISTLALLQVTRARNLANGKILPHIFLKGTFSSISVASKKAARVKALMGSASVDLTAKLNMVKASIGIIKQAIGNANLDLARRDKAYRDKVTGLIVEGCLTGFATGGLVAAAAFAAYSGTALAAIPALLAAGTAVFGNTDNEGQPAESIEEGGENVEANDQRSGANDTNGIVKQGMNATKDAEEDSADEPAEAPEDKTQPSKKSDKAIPTKDRIKAAQDTWMSLSSLIRSAKNAAHATELGKALFNKMSLVDLFALVQLVKTAIIVMERTVEAVEHLARPLDDLLSSVSGVADILVDMDAQCRLYQIKAGNEPVNFGKKEAEVVQAKWDEVSEACEAWLDIFNAQRISPITFSIIEK